MKGKIFSPCYPDLWDQAVMDELAARWKQDVWDIRVDVDAQGDSCWGDLAMGFALGNSLTPDQAFDFERYTHHLGIL
jgi:hypothetical protein